MSTIVLVAPSPHPRSRLVELHRRTGEALRGAGFRVRSLPVHQLPESALLSGRADAPALRWARRTVTRADGIVLVNPSYEAPLSRLVHGWLELMPPLRGRAVQAVCLGAAHAQASGADYGVRRLLLRHGAERVAPTCFLFDKWFTPAADGWRLGAQAAERLETGIAGFTRELASGPVAA